MVTIRKRYTSKASALKSLRANNIKFCSIRTIKRAGKTTTGLYAIKLKR